MQRRKLIVAGASLAAIGALAVGVTGLTAGAETEQASALRSPVQPEVNLTNSRADQFGYVKRGAWYRSVAINEWVAATLANQARASRVRGGGGGGGGGGCAATDWECFKACTIAIESGGNYAAVGGQYRGAWQFDQQTWDSNAAASGRTDLVGADPAAVDAGSQDQIAYDTYSRRGKAPWGGRC